MRAIAAKICQFAAMRFFGTLVACRRVLVGVSQLALFAFANWTAFELRFDGEIPLVYVGTAWQGLPVVLVVMSAGFWVCGVQQGLWRYVGVHDLGRILAASIAGAFSLIVILSGLFQWTHYPRSVIILTGLLCGFYLVGAKLAVRWFREWTPALRSTDRRVLVVGAGDAGELLAG